MDQDNIPPLGFQNFTPLGMALDHERAQFMHREKLNAIFGGSWRGPKAFAQANVRADGRLTMAAGRILLSVLLIAVIFSLDTFTHIRSAFAVLYVMPLLIAGGDLRELSIVRWSLTCAALTLVSYGINHWVTTDFPSVMRVFISLAANGVTTILILRAKSIYATLHLSEARYRTIFNSLAVAVWEHDFRPVQAAIDAVCSSGVEDLRKYVAENPHFVIETRRLVPIIDVNDTAVRLLRAGSKQDFFAHLSDFLPETDESFAECILAIDEGRTLFQAETRVIARDGTVIDVIVAMGFSDNGELDRVACSAFDVTEARRMSEIIDHTRSRLERAQRAAALGQLTAAIAHELNQPLSAIRSCANAACRWLRRDPPNIAEADQALETVVEAVRQADEVIRGVRTLTGKAKPDLRFIEIDGLICDCAALMQRELADQRAKLVLSLGAPGTTIRADRILLQQVLVNLIMNSVQAMESYPDAARIVSITSKLEAEWLLITVADRGPGWDAEYLDMAFEAFQTTKPEGMGLGLSISRAAIDAHGGAIDLLNHDGGGACVEIRLPLPATAAIMFDSQLAEQLIPMPAQR